MPNPRKPNRLKVLEGTAEPRRLYGEPQLPEATDFTPPDALSGPDAVEAWQSITDHLGPARVLATDDLLLLVHLCNLHAHCLKVWRVGSSPTAAELTQLRLMAGEFGLTPATRSKAGTLADKPGDNPFARLGSS